MTKNKFDYSTEMLYNCSPKGYKLLRDSKNIILLCYSTIKRLTLSIYGNSLTEQHDNSFLIYIKNKFKSLVQQDTAVSLLFDEIHLKFYFDYGGVTLLAYLTTAMKLQQVLLLLCLAVYSHNIMMLCMLCQLNVLKTRIYLT